MGTEKEGEGKEGCWKKYMWWKRGTPLAPIYKRSAHCNKNEVNYFRRGGHHEVTQNRKEKTAKTEWGGG